MSKTAIIIGAGPAGLTAAYKLAKETDIKPVIVEKESFVGGISRTAEHNGNRIDIGGHRLFTKSDQVMTLWQELMPVQGKPSWDDILLGTEKPFSKGGPDPEKEDRALLIRSRVSRILYLRKFFDYPISLKFRTFANMGLRKTVRAGAAYIKSRVKKRNEVTLEDFMINRFGTALYEMFFKDYTYKVWGKDPKEISADWGAQRIKGLSLMKALLFMLKKPFMGRRNDKNIETSLIERFYYPKKGPGQLWETMADEIVEMGGVIHFRSKVTGVEFRDNKIVSVKISSGSEQKELKADYFLSSMAVSDLIAAMDREIPENIRNIAAGLPYRDFMTVGLLVDKLKIKNTTKIKTVSDIVPDCWIYIQEPDVKAGRLQIFNNWSPYMVKDPKNTVWLGLEYFCEKGDEMWELSDKEFIKFAAEEAVRIGIIENTSVQDSVRIKVEKAYPSYFGTYEMFDAVRDYLSGIENLYCIGRNGQHRYNNMDHSMLTAIEAVRLIMAGDLNKESLFKVNTEAEYHETK